MPGPPDAAIVEQTTVRGLSLYRAVQPVRDFVREQVSGGILLLAMTVIALVWANSPWAASYRGLWDTELAITLGRFSLAHSLRDWINDGLMALFFFVVGLEIKREVLVGQLSTRRGAMLPFAAALGGMVLPAVLYLVVNAGGPGANGWAIPMATDIAFALGVLAVLGDRIPAGARIFLTALAIIDDIGAVLVIALVYTGGIAWPPVLVTATILVALFLLNRAGIQHPVVYAVLGLGIWLAVSASGIHATVGGVLVAMLIPVRTWIHPAELVAEGRVLLDDLAAASPNGASVLSDDRQQATIQRLARAATGAETPLQRLEHALNPWVAYAIVPLFALANAGVMLPADLGGVLREPVLIGVVIGLVIGKPVGIVALAWLAVRLGLTQLPDGVSWRLVVGLGWIAGIGFTMSLFITGLALAGELAAAAKLGIIAGSLVAGVIGWGIIRVLARLDPAEDRVADG